jgi:hypothetical protein
MINSAPLPQAQGRTVDDYIREISEYWNDDELMEQFGRVLGMYDIIVEAGERLTKDEIEDICRDIYWTPAAFRRFIEIGKLHQENERDKSGFPTLIEQVNITSPTGAAVNNPQDVKLVEIEAQLRPLITAHIKAIIRSAGALEVKKGPVAKNQFNFGVCLTHVDQTDKRHFKLRFSIGDRLRGTLGLIAGDVPEFNVFIETWASWVMGVTLSSTDIEKYLSKMRIDELSRNRILDDLNALDMDALSNKIRPVVTELALEGSSA